MKAILNKFKNMPENLKATLVFAIASFATSGINYITTPIFTRLLSGAEYGTVAVYSIPCIFISSARPYADAIASGSGKSWV